MLAIKYQPIGIEYLKYVLIYVDFFKKKSSKPISSKYIQDNTD